MALARKKKTSKASTNRRTAGKAKKSGPRKAGKAASHEPRRTNADLLDDLIKAAAPALGLSMKPEWRSAVRANLHVIFGQAALFAEFELPDDAEPAPIFKA